MLRTKLDLKRHYSELPEKETLEVVGIIAGLIVAYLAKKRGCSNRGSGTGRVRTSEGRR